MKKNIRTVFFSYSNKNRECALKLIEALRKRKVHVWFDRQSVTGGERWSEAIDEGIRSAHGIVVLLTPQSASSKWVVHEYGFARGAGIAGIAVQVGDAKVPGPLRNFQPVQLGDSYDLAAQSILLGIETQLSAPVQPVQPKAVLMAKFRENNGQLKIVWDPGDDLPSFRMELWMEKVPPQTKKVAFEIADTGFDDRKWTKKRRPATDSSAREFLTRKMYSFGDVEVWTRGFGEGIGAWSTSSDLYAALMRYYRGRKISKAFRQALTQIRDN